MAGEPSTATESYSDSQLHCIC